MPYIDSDYYLNEYKGQPPEDLNQLQRMINKASDDIDRLTGYRIQDFENQPLYVQNQIKKATAAQTEHLTIYGENPEPIPSVSIGKFKITGSSVKVSEYANNVLPLIQSSGVLYSGIRGL